MLKGIEVPAPWNATHGARQQRDSRGSPIGSWIEIGGPLVGQPARNGPSGGSDQTKQTGATSTNTVVAQPKPPEKRKVAGSIPALATMRARW
ncbi:Uncharacterised protein [Mycobacteroides abscessus subsp. abscessus]|nr:Uncharacterised protein [Mycobacteroides abscessus subsp. abscessus]SHX72686.1 Uncharacterised protein [Mycobacteroides abscessus subsp. abscessus]SIG87227.1 Uncharacterised protein [Mycobacteroides abscessus subsp. abscessus]SKD18831.1 Uncharacterised protein [Mycobacteroides abscessus subsp. abscessus]SKN10426.1 Uncharacterised protein [Mycobacteroides abscessus subsp. abscessus]